MKIIAKLPAPFLRLFYMKLNIHNRNVTRRMNKFIIGCDSLCDWSGRRRRTTYVRLAAQVPLIDDGSHNISREIATPVVKYRYYNHLHHGVALFSSYAIGTHTGLDFIKQMI